MTMLLPKCLRLRSQSPPDEESFRLKCPPQPQCCGRVLHQLPAVTGSRNRDESRSDRRLTRRTLLRRLEALVAQELCEPIGHRRVPPPSTVEAGSRIWSLLQQESFPPLFPLVLVKQLLHACLSNIFGPSFTSSEPDFFLEDFCKPAPLRSFSPLPLPVRAGHSGLSPSQPIQQVISQFSNLDCHFSARTSPLAIVLYLRLPQTEKPPANNGRSWRCFAFGPARYVF